MGVNVNIEDNGYLGIQKDSSIGYAYHRMLLDERGIPIDYVLLKTNTAYKQLIGISEDQILGRKFTELLSDQMKDELDYIEKFGRVALHNESFKFEFYSEPLNKWYLVSAFSVQYLCFTLMFHDITDTKNLVNKLQKANYLNEILLNAIPHPALLIRKDRKVIAANKIAREAGSIIGGYCWRDWGACQYINAEDMARVSTYNVGTDKVIRCHFCKGDVALRKNGAVNIKEKLGEIFWDIYWVPTQEKDVYLHYAIDITEQIKTQEEIARLDRLNLIGQVAAGIGHEIRNPLTVVRGYLQLMGSRPEFQSQNTTIETMINALDQANSIITEFLLLARNKPTEMEMQNIDKLLMRLYPLLEADAFTQNKQLVIETGETPDILLDSKEISQLVLNLCRNGLEAMSEGGMLTMRTFVQDQQVILSVQDQGSGIPAEYLDKLGTPFFTTKDTGTGLGLATSYCIAERHNARITVETGADGTIFFVQFSIPSRQTLQ